MTGAREAWLKLENMQRTGTYRLRGAYNKMSQLPEADLEKGVVASSAGNHAQGSRSQPKPSASTLPSSCLR